MTNKNIVINETEQQMNKIKEENKILIMLAFFSISVGLWENFRQLWLQDNNFAITNIKTLPTP